MPTTNADIDRLTSEMLKAAHFFLEDCGKFDIYSMALGIDHQTLHMIADMGPFTRTPEQKIADAVKSLRSLAEKNQILASAIGCDVRFRLAEHLPSQDALRLDVEHRDGEVFTACVPYTLADGKATFGEAFRLPGEKKVFSPSRT